MFNSMEKIKSDVDNLIKDEQKHVAEIYVSCIRPFVSSGGDIQEFISPIPYLQQIPAGTIKIRRYLFQVLLLLDIYRMENKSDPLPDEILNQILYLVRSIAPLALAMSKSVITGFFDEMQSIHGEYFPNTIFFLTSSLGLVEKTPDFTPTESVEMFRSRVHYVDGNVAKTGLEEQPNNTILNGPLFLNKDSKSKLKKPKHGPETHSKPLFHK